MQLLKILYLAKKMLLTDFLFYTYKAKTELKYIEKLFLHYKHLRRVKYLYIYLDLIQNIMCTNVYNTL